MANRMFVCGVQDACVWLTGCLYVVYRMLVCGVQDVCVWCTGCLCVVYRMHVCGRQDICVYNTLQYNNTLLIIKNKIQLSAFDK